MFHERRYRFPAIAAVLKPNSRVGAKLQLNRSLWKGKVRMSNWERYNLTSQQVDYAANDALASYLVYQRLIHLAAALPVDIGPVVTFDVRAEKKLEDVINAKRKVKSGREDDGTQFFLEGDAAASKVVSGPAGKENCRRVTPTPFRPDAELGGAALGMEGQPRETVGEVAAFLEANKESLDDDEGDWES
ncbi:MAG: hypothetical protein BJ554DRAFT_2674 [Olpidium bornovanus]|uniref:Uncharacterized protein n=1 Tax=Olpidium bornovanus TaxID=278681 RepID=A0A8H8DGS1_9FUNG|nr:MAG: hypothetical protein BJ554DRAFT_2674 [Olpidium bornovanus]